MRVLSADLSNPQVLAHVRAVTDDIEIGLLVCNAGANNTRGLFVELPEAVTQSVIAINVLGHANFARHYGALMVKRKRGGIIHRHTRDGAARHASAVSTIAQTSCARMPFVPGKIRPMRPAK